MAPTEQVISDWDYIKRSEWWLWVNFQVEEMRSAAINKLLVATSMDQVKTAQSIISTLTRFMNIIANPEINKED